MCCSVSIEHNDKNHMHYKGRSQLSLSSPIGQREVTLGQTDWNHVLMVTVYHKGAGF